MSNVPRMIAVDFDGTVCNFAYPGIGEPQAGVRDALTKLKELGFHLHIYSCRSCHWYPEIFTPEDEKDTAVLERKTVVAMKEYLDKHQIPYDTIDDGSKGKPMCDYYIDDKGVRFDNNWQEIAHAITLQESFGIKFRQKLEW